jgi:soluble lytic murein transglycosylase-like protein
VKPAARLVWGAALWLFLAPARAAGAEEAMFAPRTQAGPAREAASAPGAAARPPVSAGLFPPDLKTAERGRPAAVEPGGEGRREAENPAPRQPPAEGRGLGEGKPYWEVEARRGGVPYCQNGENPYCETEARRDDAPGLQSRGAEKNYRENEANGEAPPYFQADVKKQASPYWRAGEKREPSAAPYWRAKEADRERPYWEPPPERVEMIAPADWPAAGRRPAGEEPAGNPRLSYFMYQDEFGVKHLTNVPVDPRYREFTVFIRVGRSLAGTRAGPLRFTHENLRPLILQAARTYNLDPALIAAVIKSESAFDAQAVSWSGAQGLMQLMPGTARDMECDDPFDPAQNIMAGSRYLRLMLDTFGGDLDLAVAAYNCGPEQVSRLWRVPDIAETKNYVIIVSRNYERYKGRL